MDRFIRLFIKMSTRCLKITQTELLSMLKAVLEEFSIPELCRLLPAEGLANLLAEVRYLAEDAIIGTFQRLFEAHPDTEGGFAFEDKGLRPAP